MDYREPDRIEKRLLFLLRCGIFIVTLAEIPGNIARKTLQMRASKIESAKRRRLVLMQNFVFCLLGEGKAPRE
jgi:hypothetical protein